MLVKAVNDLAVHPRLISGYGLVEAPFERVLAQFGAHRRAEHSVTRLLETTAEASKALHHLGVRTVPATRLVVLEHGSWTAILTNHRAGSDFSDHQLWAANVLSVRTVRVVDSDARWWRRGPRRERLGYEARIFELHGPDDATIRSIACADDGDRWVFETFGEPLAIEATFDYDAPRKKDRFTRGNLRALLAAIGAEPLTGGSLLGALRFGLLSEELMDPAWRERVRDQACSLEEADDPAFGYYRRGLTWVPHMRTHATSVIADFERAVEIDPTYEPRVRAFLQEAHRIVGR